MSVELITSQKIEENEIAVTKSATVQIGTGDSQTVSFTASLEYAIIPTTLRITVGDETLVLKDDGNGHIVDDDGTQYGTTDYKNVISLTFPTAPAQYDAIVGTYSYTYTYTYHYEITGYTSVDGFFYLCTKYKQGSEDSATIQVQVTPDSGETWFNVMKADNITPLALTLEDGMNARVVEKVRAGDQLKFVVELTKNVVPNQEIAKFTAGTVTMALE